MDRNWTNSVISRLPIAMAGIVHVNGNNGRTLSIFKNLITLHNCEMPFLPSPGRI
ncbi:hypothetical protein [Paenibacillus wynnii]|uniref:hypothetical protein n=1 Tax=Paenibacillus wynnii TaxID=268407 RepID=UPI0014705382|nr:hypothetical protein [Paenibacillus wynnii]MDQ0195137.1 hypothetical protein [Paenibacillus wynnii]